MLKSKKLLTEDLLAIDWSKFNCQAIVDEATEEFKIVCTIQSEYPHVVAPIKAKKSQWEKLDDIWF
ncbi:MAG: hypothetical protein QNJ54_31320 [Prochloraceae cyanobacterium]|nr:hypothetical protein [Prochloraceae cyanobacterium]